jgi:hypothetical protein
MRSPFNPILLQSLKQINEASAKGYGKVGAWQGVEVLAGKPASKPDQVLDSGIIHQHPGWSCRVTLPQSWTLAAGQQRVLKII